MAAFGLISLPENTGELASWLPCADKLPAWLVERFPQALVDVLARHAEPAIMGQIPEIRSKDGGSAEGWIIGCPVSPGQALRIHPDFLMKRINDAVRVAWDHGVNVLGFDDLDRILFARRLDPYACLGIAATAGRGIRIAGQLQVLKSVAFHQRIDIIDDDTVVLGADSEAGAISARLWARHSRRLTLIGDDRFRLETLRRRILSETGLSCRISADLSSLRNAAIVIDAAGVPAEVLGASLGPKSVLLRDIGTYRDNSISFVQEYQFGRSSSGKRASARKPPGDHMALEFTSSHPSAIIIDDLGFIVPGERPRSTETSRPGEDFKQGNFEVSPSAAEAAVLAIEGYVEPPGPGRRISLAWVEKLGELAQKHGFRPVGRGLLPVSNISPGLIHLQDGANTAKN